MSDIPEWAEKIVSRLFDSEHDGKGGEHAYAVLHRAFARYVYIKEDPVVLEAREILASHWEAKGNPIEKDIASDIRDGIHDDDEDEMALVLTSLRRGIEIGKAQS